MCDFNVDGNNVQWNVRYKFCSHVQSFLDLEMYTFAFCVWWNECDATKNEREKKWMNSDADGWK